MSSAEGEVDYRRAETGKERWKMNQAEQWEGAESSICKRDETQMGGNFSTYSKAGGQGMGSLGDEGTGGEVGVVCKAQGLRKKRLSYSRASPQILKTIYFVRACPSN